LKTSAQIIAGTVNVTTGVSLDGDWIMEKIIFCSLTPCVSPQRRNELEKMLGYLSNFIELKYF